MYIIITDKLPWQLINSAAGQAEHTCRAQKVTLPQIDEQQNNWMNREEGQRTTHFLDGISEQAAYLIQSTVPFLKQVISF